MSFLIFVLKSYKLIVNNNSAGAVADGCVIWQVGQSMVNLTVRFSYGIVAYPSYNPILPHHRGRRKSMSHSGELHVTGGWSEILKRVGSTINSVVILTKEELGNLYELRRSEKGDILAEI